MSSRKRVVTIVVLWAFVQSSIMVLIVLGGGWIGWATHSRQTFDAVGGLGILMILFTSFLFSYSLADPYAAIKALLISQIVSFSVFFAMISNVLAEIAFTPPDGSTGFLAIYLIGLMFLIVLLTIIASLAGSVIEERFDRSKPIVIP